LDNLVLATSQYMAGNYDGHHPFDTYAHSFAFVSDAISRLEHSVFYKFMTPDSVVIFDANPGLVQDVTPGRENTGAFYLGEMVADSIAGRNGNDFLEGFGGNDTLRGAAGNDVLAGRAGDDFMGGGTGNDLLLGGGGKDNMWGGGGADTFDFKALSQTPAGAGDIIRDFDHSAKDIIDLAGIDAKAGVVGNQAFTFIGNQAFHNVEGELRFSADGVLQGDTNGDGVADLVIHVAGVSSLVAADFVL
jgi:Ca2+-binding RTX toxin-like protein